MGLISVSLDRFSKALNTLKCAILSIKGFDLEF
jgi:hypothetical protein